MAELQSEDQALAVIEAMARDDETVPEYLCLVEFHSVHGSVLGTDTSIKIRTLS